MRGKWKWFAGVGLAVLGLIASLIVGPWSFECALFTDCHKNNDGYALVSIFSQQIRDLMAGEEIHLQIAHSASFTLIGAVLGFLIGLYLDFRSSRSPPGFSAQGASDNVSGIAGGLANNPLGAAQLELTGEGEFRTSRLRTDQFESSGMRGGIVVGRSPPDSGLCVEHESVSRQHVRLSATGDQFMVEDLGSTNGTRLNGQRLRPHEPTPLCSGDRLSIGSANFAVVVTRT